MARQFIAFAREKVGEDEVGRSGGARSTRPCALASPHSRRVTAIMYIRSRRDKREFGKTPVYFPQWK
jgi:hypothetical protein